MSPSPFDETLSEYALMGYRAQESGDADRAKRRYSNLDSGAALLEFLGLRSDGDVERSLRRRGVRPTGEQIEAVRNVVIEHANRRVREEAEWAKFKARHPSRGRS